jgi:hypothetical protein
MVPHLLYPHYTIATPTLRSTSFFGGGILLTFVGTKYLPALHATRAFNQMHASLLVNAE